MKGNILDVNHIRENSFSSNKLNDKMTCIYFLLHEDEIVYIGQSTSPQTRIKQHVREAYVGEFDGIYFHFCDPDMLDELEARYITTFKPKYNSVVNNKFLQSVDSAMIEYVKNNKDEIINLLKVKGIDVFEFKGKNYIQKEIQLSNLLIDKKAS